MIIDKITNLKLYESLFPVDKVLAFVEKAEKENLPAGRYDLDGDDLFALLQENITKPQAETRMESHKLYIDIQYIVKGVECIGWDPADELKVEEDRTPESDVIFYECETPGTVNELKAGMFGIYLPTDGHMPGMAAGDCAPVRKIVFKIKCR